jgi:hypothetical protein
MPQCKLLDARCSSKAASLEHPQRRAEMKKPKSVKAWGMQNGLGRIIAETIRATKKDYKKCFGNEYQPIPVLITPITRKKK